MLRHIDPREAEGTGRTLELFGKAVTERWSEYADELAEKLFISALRFWFRGKRPLLVVLTACLIVVRLLPSQSQAGLLYG